MGKNTKILEIINSEDINKVKVLIGSEEKELIVPLDIVDINENYIVTHYNEKIPLTAFPFSDTEPRTKNIKLSINHKDLKKIIMSACDEYTYRVWSSMGYVESLYSSINKKIISVIVNDEGYLDKNLLKYTVVSYIYNCIFIIIFPIAPFDTFLEVKGLKKYFWDLSRDIYGVIKKKILM